MPFLYGKLVHGMTIVAISQQISRIWHSNVQKMYPWFKLDAVESILTFSRLIQVFNHCERLAQAEIWKVIKAVHDPLTLI